MRYVEAPEPLGGFGRDRILFLGGGITDCPDWQHELVEHYSKFMDDLTILNPRRINFPMGDPDAGRRQIEWEHRALRLAHVVCFWFPKETLCPITLYELGYWTARAQYEIHGGKRIVVGCDPEYKRLFDVQVQTELTLPRETVYTDFDDFTDAVANAV